MRYMKKSHIIFVSFCVGWIILFFLAADPAYVEKYGEGDVVGGAIAYLIPFGISYWFYLRIEKKRKSKSLT
jgi:hypothetical protein